MLNLPTVLVLGAGASQPYNFPIGAQLSKEIVDGLNVGNEFFRRLKEMCGFTEEALLEFRQMFLQSGRYSIDAFLEYSDKHLAIGKSAIAYHLILKEQSERIYSLPEIGLENSTRG